MGIFGRTVGTTQTSTTRGNARCMTCVSIFAEVGYWLGQSRGWKKAKRGGFVNHAFRQVVGWVRNSDILDVTIGS